MPGFKVTVDWSCGHADHENSVRVEILECSRPGGKATIKFKPSYSCVQCNISTFQGPYNQTFPPQGYSGRACTEPIDTTFNFMGLYIRLHADPIEHAWEQGRCTKCSITCSHSDSTDQPDCTTSAVCTICGETIPALGHDYQPTIIPRTCEEDGYTLHTCSRCQDSYTDTIVPHCGHWYGEWTANGNDMHRAECLRGGCRHEKTVACEMIDLPSLNVALCPVCGTVNDGSRLALTSASVQIVSGRIPYGEAILRLGTLASGENLLTVGYGYGGQLSQASCQVKITLPAELLSGCTLSLLNADGTETAVDFTVDGESAVFTLTFAQSLLPVRLVPAN